jgi:hypothetical protein
MTMSFHAPGVADRLDQHRDMPSPVIVARAENLSTNLASSPSKASETELGPVHRYDHWHANPPDAWRLPRRHAA